jgi:hypothetical protein
MAADLTADIEEAEVEGGSAEDVVGNSVLDPSASRHPGLAEVVGDGHGDNPEPSDRTLPAGVALRDSR